MESGRFGCRSRSPSNICRCGGASRAQHLPRQYRETSPRDWGRALVAPEALRTARGQELTCVSAICPRERTFARPMASGVKWPVSDLRHEYAYTTRLRHTFCEHRRPACQPLGGIALYLSRPVERGSGLSGSLPAQFPDALEERPDTTRPGRGSHPSWFDPGRCASRCRGIDRRDE